MQASPPALLVDFQVRKDHLPTHRVAMPKLAALAEGEVVLQIDHFAFTANNVTYGAFGNAMSYWSFFPSDDAQWGRIPVWGFGTVLASRSEGVAAGERFYGYYPMSSHVVLQPARVDARGFSDGAAHRSALHAVYNYYLRTSADPGYRPDTESQQMLLRPLFITSFLIDDFLDDNGFFGARRVVLSSASSKTAYGTAFLLSERKRRGADIEIVGLTSTGNVAFVESLGIYDKVVAYDAVTSLSTDAASVYVDMAGSTTLRSGLHHHLGDGLKYSCAVGGTHWENLGGGAALPGPRPVLFFAPAQIKKRHAEWTPAGLQERIALAWAALMVPLTGAGTGRAWMKVVTTRGAEQVGQVYDAMLAGRAPPDEGHILSLLA